MQNLHSQSGDSDQKENAISRMNIRTTETSRGKQNTSIDASPRTDNLSEEKKSGEVEKWWEWGEEQDESTSRGLNIYFCRRRGLWEARGFQAGKFEEPRA